MGVHVRLLNIFLQTITLLSRFLFIFFLAKFVEPSVLGQYGLFVATVSFVLYFVGLDFYTYTTRELLKTSKDKWGGFIKNQILLSAVLYLLLILFLLISVFFDFFPMKLACWFFIILLSEHINQEIYRILVIINAQLVASLLLFIKQGLWSVLLVLIMLFEPHYRNLEAIFSFWLFFGILSIFLSLFYFKRIQIGGWSNKIDLNWIFIGVKTSAFFLLSTLALRGIQTFDRYWIGYLNNLDIVGAYVFFSGITNALMVFLDAGVFSYSYPALIGYHNKNDVQGFKNSLFKMCNMTILLIILFIISSFVFMPYLLVWTGKIIFSHYLIIYQLLLLAVMFNALSMIPHYALYAKNLDKQIIYGHLFSILVFIITTFVVSYVNKVSAVPIGVVSAFLFIFIWKVFSYIKYKEIPNNVFI